MPEQSKGRAAGRVVQPNFHRTAPLPRRAGLPELDSDYIQDYCATAPGTWTAPH